METVSRIGHHRQVGAEGHTVDERPRETVQEEEGKILSGPHSNNNKAESSRLHRRLGGCAAISAGTISEWFLGVLVTLIIVPIPPKLAMVDLH